MTDNKEKQFIKLVQGLQKDVWKDKKEKGFNAENVPLEFCLTSGGLAEARVQLFLALVD